MREKVKETIKDVRHIIEFELLINSKFQDLQFKDLYDKYIGIFRNVKDLDELRINLNKLKSEEMSELFYYPTAIYYFACCGGKNDFVKASRYAKYLLCLLFECSGIEFNSDFVKESERPRYSKAKEQFQSILVNISNDSRNLLAKCIIKLCRLLFGNCHIFVSRDTKISNANSINYTFLHELAELFWMEDQYEMAIDLYDFLFWKHKTSSSMDSSTILNGYNILALCHIEIYQYSSAYKALSKGIRYAEELGDKHKVSNYLHRMYSNMAYLYGVIADLHHNNYMQNQLRTAALSYIEKSIEYRPGDPGNYCTKATLLYDLERYEDALSAYSEYIDVLGGRKLSKYLICGDMVMALRSIIEIHLELYLQECNYCISTCNKKRFTSKRKVLFDYISKYKEWYDIAIRLNRLDLGEKQKAEMIISIYSLCCDDKEYVSLNMEIAFRLLLCYFAAEKVRLSLQFKFDGGMNYFDSIEDLGKGISKKLTGVDIAYYTKLQHTEYLLNKVTRTKNSSQSVKSGVPEEEEENWVLKQDEKNCLTLMHVSYMNDPNEGFSLINALSKDFVHQTFMGMKPEEFKQKLLDEQFVFLKSFTSSIDQLNMWVTYGSDKSDGVDSNGCCICIAPESFEMMKYSSQKLSASKESTSFKPKDDFQLYRVVYLDKDGNPLSTGANHDLFEKWYTTLKKLCRCLESYTNSDAREQIQRHLGQILSFIAFLFKDESYCMEEELRLVLRRNRAWLEDVQKTEGIPPLLYIQPFHQIYVDKIILGPNVKNVDNWVPHLQMKLTEMWMTWPKQNEQRVPIVRKSKIPYR